MHSHSDATVATYDNSAKKFSDYFDSLGPRKKDIERGFSLGPKSANRQIVIEIGCGNGRDATEIIKHDCSYIGLDPSAGLLKIARERLPETQFVCEYPLKYRYPKDIDIVFSFAALLHLDKENCGKLFQKIAKKLRPGGIVYISTKQGEYSSKLKKDTYGERNFYLYMPEDLEAAAGKTYERIFLERQHFADSDWFTLVLRKRS